MLVDIVHNSIAFTSGTFFEWTNLTILYFRNHYYNRTNMTVGIIKIFSR